MPDKKYHLVLHEEAARNLAAEQELQAQFASFERKVQVQILKLSNTSIPVIRLFSFAEIVALPYIS